nr:hypothetical protein CFP56_72367 [Quercus suber]
MFATFRCSPNRKAQKQSELADTSSAFRIGVPHHSACRSCRERKLRCDGQKPCCERCRDGSSKCEYILLSKRRSRRTRPSDVRKEIEGSGTLCSPGTQSSTVSPASSNSRSCVQSNENVVMDAPWAPSVDLGYTPPQGEDGLMLFPAPEDLGLADMDAWHRCTGRLMIATPVNAMNQTILTGP